MACFILLYWEVANKEGRDYTGDCESMNSVGTKADIEINTAKINTAEWKLNGFIQSDCIYGIPESEYSIT